MYHKSYVNTFFREREGGREGANTYIMLFDIWLGGRLGSREGIKKTLLFSGHVRYQGGGSTPLPLFHIIFFQNHPFQAFLVYTCKKYIKTICPLIAGGGVFFTRSLRKFSEIFVREFANNKIFLPKLSISGLSPLKNIHIL